MKITCPKCGKSFTEIPHDHECDCGGTVRIEVEETVKEEVKEAKAVKTKKEA